jgi:hypothetical protein
MRADRWLAAAALATLVAAPAPARAFCRTTTCEPSCGPDPACPSCLVGGLPLYWPGGCVSFSVRDAGSARSGIASGTVSSLVTAAFARWIGVACGGGGTPGIQVFDFGATSCGVPEFDKQGPNANVWMFRDDQWPHAGSQLALTTVTYGIDTGKLYDADVEINSAENELTVGDGAIVWDLESIIVHEAGHFLGLAHSCAPGATMAPSFGPGDTSLRTLALDDVQAICSVYPPGSANTACDPTPRNGLATDCSGSSSGGGGSYGSQQSAAETKGCSCGLPRRGDRQAWLTVAALLAGFGLRRRTRRSAGR